MSSEKGPSPAGTGAGGSTAASSTRNRLTTLLRDAITKVISTSSTILDRALPPQRREQYKNWLIKFATERPYLASFLLSQIALSGLPLVLFCCMTVSVFIFSILAGVLLGVIGGLLFAVPAMGLALLILLPVLFFTTAAAVSIWLWGVGGYNVIKWLSHRGNPGVQSDVKGPMTKVNGGAFQGAGANGGGGPPTGQTQQQQGQAGGGPQPLSGMSRGPPPNTQRPGPAPQPRPAGLPQQGQGQPPQNRPSGVGPPSQHPPSQQSRPGAPSQGGPPPQSRPGPPLQGGQQQQQQQARPPTPGPPQQQHSTNGEGFQGQNNGPNGNGNGNSPPQQQQAVKRKPVSRPTSPAPPEIARKPVSRPTSPAPSARDRADSAASNAARGPGPGSNGSNGFGAGNGNSNPGYGNSGYAQRPTGMGGPGGQY